MTPEGFTTARRDKYCQPTITFWKRISAAAASCLLQGAEVTDVERQHPSNGVRLLLQPGTMSEMPPQMDKLEAVVVMKVRS